MSFCSFLRVGILTVLLLLMVVGCEQKRLTPFMQAGYDGNKTTIDELISGGENINQQDKGGNTVLIYALQRGLNVYGQKENDIKFIKELLDYDADVNLSNNLGNTPLMYAALAGNEKALRLLIENGADIHARNKNGNTALLLAAAGGQAHDAVLPLIICGADINARNRAGQTSYSAAISWKEYHAAEVIKNYAKKHNIFLETVKD